MHCIDEMAQFAIVFVPSSDSGSSTATFANLFFECHVGQEGKITEVIEELNQTCDPRIPSFAHSYTMSNTYAIP